MGICRSSSRGAMHRFSRSARTALADERLVRQLSAGFPVDALAGEALRRHVLLKAAKATLLTAFTPHSQADGEKAESPVDPVDPVTATATSARTLVIDLEVLCSQVQVYDQNRRFVQRVWLRPHARLFLDTVRAHFRLAVWSKAGRAWINTALLALDPQQQVLPRRCQLGATAGSDDESGGLPTILDDGVAVDPADVAVITLCREAFGSLGDSVIEVTPYDTNRGQHDTVLVHLASVLVRHLSAVRQSPLRAPVRAEILRLGLGLAVFGQASTSSNGYTGLTGTSLQLELEEWPMTEEYCGAPSASSSSSSASASSSGIILQPEGWSSAFDASTPVPADTGPCGPSQLARLELVDVRQDGGLLRGAQHSQPPPQRHLPMQQGGACGVAELSPSVPPPLRRLSCRGEDDDMERVQHACASAGGTMSYSGAATAAAPLVALAMGEHTGGDDTCAVPCLRLRWSASFGPCRRPRDKAVSGAAPVHEGASAAAPLRQSTQSPQSTQLSLKAILRRLTSMMRRARRQQSYGTALESDSRSSAPGGGEGLSSSSSSSLSSSSSVSSPSALSMAERFKVEAGVPCLASDCSRSLLPPPPPVDAVEEEDPAALLSGRNSNDSACGTATSSSSRSSCEYSSNSNVADNASPTNSPGCSTYDVNPRPCSGEALRHVLAAARSGGISSRNGNGATPTVALGEGVIADPDDDADAAAVAAAATRLVTAMRARNEAPPSRISLLCSTQATRRCSVGGSSSSQPRSPLARGSAYCDGEVACSSRCESKDCRGTCQEAAVPAASTTCSSACAARAAAAFGSAISSEDDAAASELCSPSKPGFLRQDVACAAVTAVCPWASTLEEAGKDRAMCEGPCIIALTSRTDVGPFTSKRSSRRSTVQFWVC